MQFHTPRFWYQNDNVSKAIAFALTPLSLFYAAGHFFHHVFKKPYISKIPVLCVGNIVVGGAGKTPTVLSLIDLIKAHDLAKNPVILTRGYGGTKKGPFLIDLKAHDFRDTGDEAILLAKKAPVIVGAERDESAKMAEALGHDLIIMDDGMQNPGLKKDLIFCVVDGKTKLGNNRLVPAGPMREPLQKALNRVDAFIVNRPDKDFKLSEKPHFNAFIETRWQPKEGRKYIGFSGIALPEKFKNTLLEQGTDLLDFMSFADHHAFSTEDIQNLKKKAEAENAQLITTEKDFVRIPVDLGKDIETLPISLMFSKEEQLAQFLREKLKQGSEA